MRWTSIRCIFIIIVCLDRSTFSDTRQLMRMFIFKRKTKSSIKLFDWQQKFRFIPRTLHIIKIIAVYQKMLICFCDNTVLFFLMFFVVIVIEWLDLVLHWVVLTVRWIYINLILMTMVVVKCIEYLKLRSAFLVF